MRRRELLRNTLLGTAGAAFSRTPASAEIPPGQEAAKELASPDWKPLFLDSHQNETLIAISDLIIPSTDTPGAKAALVNRFLDLLMSAEKTETQQEFLTSLAFIDGACRQRYQAVFIYLSRDQQNDFLTLLAYPHSHATWGEKAADFPGYDHFQRLKQWIVGAYYSSPEGLKEMGWDGTFPHGHFGGCDHPTATPPHSHKG